MKKVVLNYLVIAALAGAAAFTSCDKNNGDGDDGGNGNGNGGGGMTITATVENGSKFSNIVTVKAVVRDRSTDKEVEIASGDFKNGGFTIKLPATVDAKYLSAWEDDEIPSTVTVSNKNAKTTGVDFRGVDKDGEHVTWFYQAKFTDTSGTDADYIYSDGDVNITGTYSETDENEKRTEVYSITWKKGWNIVYATGTEVEKDGFYTYNYVITSVPVTGLKWYASQDM